eukprot:8111918-Pyramimonas_sp.AAC.1
MGMPPMGSLGLPWGGCVSLTSLQGAWRMWGRAGSPLGDLAARRPPPPGPSHTGRWRPPSPIARLRDLSSLASSMFPA